MRQFLNMMKYPGGMVVDADEVILDSDDLEAIIQ